MPEIRTSLVGILNVTPDSFSDGGLYTSQEAAVSHTKKMVKEGASVIDIGAESTRPNAKRITPDEEWKRLRPILEAIVSADINAWISIDTRHPETAQKAILTGIDWLNDVSGLQNKKMLDLVKDNAVNLVVMHNLGIPADKNVTIAEDHDVTKTVMEWGNQKINELQQKGINKDRIIFDPGIGFGKTAEQSYEIIKNIKKFRKLGVRLMVGHSRKSFLSLITNKSAEKRDEETAIISAYLAHCGVDYLRVHNISVNKTAIEQSKSMKLPDIER